MLGIYEREGWAKAERELEDQRREGEAAENRWLEELGVAQAPLPSSTMLGETSSQGPPPSSLLEEHGVARAQAPPPFSTHVSMSPGLPGVTILQQVTNTSMRTGMFDPFQVLCSAPTKDILHRWYFQVVQAPAPQFHLQTLSYPGPGLPSSLSTSSSMPFTSCSGR